MIEFACPGCGKKYKVDDQLAGKRAKCKGCGGALLVPAPGDDIPAALPPKPLAPPPLRPPPPSPAPPLPVATVAPTASASAECPSCGAAMAPAAVLCIECGFDKRTGKRLAGL